MIQGEIALGSFDYRKHFPNGARLADFYPHDVIVQRGQVPLVGDYLDDWHKRRSPFLPDGKVADGGCPEVEALVPLVRRERRGGIPSVLGRCGGGDT